MAQAPSWLTPKTYTDRLPTFATPFGPSNAPATPLAGATVPVNPYNFSDMKPVGDVEGLVFRAGGTNTTYPGTPWEMLPANVRQWAGIADLTPPDIQSGQDHPTPDPDGEIGVASPKNPDYIDTITTGAKDAGTTNPGPQGQPANVPTAIVTAANQEANAAVNAAKQVAGATINATKAAVQSNQAISSSWSDMLSNFAARAGLFGVGAILLIFGLVMFKPSAVVNAASQARKAVP